MSKSMRIMINGQEMVAENDKERDLIAFIEAIQSGSTVETTINVTDLNLRQQATISAQSAAIEAMLNHIKSLHKEVEDVRHAAEMQWKRVERDRQRRADAASTLELEGVLMNRCRKCSDSTEQMEKIIYDLRLEVRCLKSGIHKPG